jgi:hypothetical protein
MLALTEGEHRVTMLDELSRSASVKFTAVGSEAGRPATLKLK